MLSAVPVLSYPVIFTRAMAAVLQNDVVSILELMRWFAASDLKRSMFGLCTMANQVCSDDDNNQA
jgi:hypothetical protein